jgi:hypothetical protein
MPQELSLSLPAAVDRGEILIEEEMAEKESFIMFIRVSIK